MPRRGGIFNRFIRVVRTAIGIPPRRKSESEYHKRARLNPQGKLTKQQREQLPRETRDRQRARQRDPFLNIWDRERVSRGNYLGHRDFIREMVREYDVPADEAEAFWRDYIKYMIKGEGRYLRKDARNRFWVNWNIDPDDFDWAHWRDEMGDSPRAGK